MLAQGALLRYCAEKGIIVEGYGVIGADDVLTQPAIRQLASDLGRTEAQVALRHTLQRGARAGGSPNVVVLAKSLTKRRIDENLRVFDFELDNAAMRALDQLASSEGRSYWDNTDVP